MPDTPRPILRVHFGPYRADLRSEELYKNGHRIKLQEKPFQLLAALLEHPGEVVTREELQHKLWPTDTFVVFEDNLNHAVKKLRDALDDSAEHPKFIETLPKRGYRLIAPVEQAEEAHQGQRIASRWVWAAGVAALLVILGTAGYFVWPRLRPGANTPARRVNLAVLPFVNLNGDPAQEFLSDGLTDEMISRLSGIRPEDLGVIARTTMMQYKRTGKSVQEIGRDLNAEFILESSLERSGERLRIRVQLIRASDQTQVWANTYDRNMRDIFALQSEVSEAIARQVLNKLTPQDLTRLARGRARHVNPEAYVAYLKGRHVWELRTREGLEKALEYFKKAVQIDAEYAPGYVGLADTYTVLGIINYLPAQETFPKAKVAARKALALDDSLAEAHAAQAAILLWFEKDWTGTEREFKRAIELNPGYATAHHWYAYYFSGMGLHEQAIAEIKRAQTLDPLSARINASFGHLLYRARRYDESIEEMRKALDLNPDDTYPHLQLCMDYSDKGMHEQAIEEGQKAFDSGRLPQADVWLARALALAGKRQEARKTLERALLQSKQRYVAPLPLPLALAYVALGEKDKAFAALERGYVDHSVGMVFVRVEPGLDPLRSDPRFQDLLRRMNFPP